MDLNQLRAKRRAAVAAMNEQRDLVKAAMQDGGSASQEQLDELEKRTGAVADLGKQIGDAEKLEQASNARAAALLDDAETAGASAGSGHVGDLARHASNSTGTRSDISNPRAMVENDPARGFGGNGGPRRFLMGVMAAGGRHVRGLRLSEAEQHGLKMLATAGSDEQGGYSQEYGGFLVPTTMLPDLLKLQADGDPTAGLTRKIPMTTPTVKLNARVDKDHSSSVSGGFQVRRRTTTQDVDATRTKLEQVTLAANSLMGIAFAEEEILTDSPISFAAIIADGMRDEFGARILEEKLRGTGTGEYKGVIADDATVAISKESNQTADTIVTQNIVKMRARCWGYKNAIWLANIDTYTQVSQLSLSVGTGGNSVMLFNIREDIGETLLGRPIVFHDFPETVGDKGDIILGNWREYLEGQLEGLSSAESMHVRFVNNERAFRFTARNDGRPWWRTALTPRKGSGTLSPFVVLNARA